MYLINRTKTILLYMLCIILILAGCQQTPEKNIVESKREGEMYKIIDDSKSSLNDYIPSFPSSLNKALQSNNNTLKINIDAIVDSGNISNYPVYIIKNKNLTNDDAEIVMNGLFGNRPLWKRDTFGFSTATKDTIEKQLDVYYTMLADEKYKDSPDFVQEIKKQIEWLLRLYPNALESRYEIPALMYFSDVNSANRLYHLDYEYSNFKTIFGEEKTEDEYLVEKNKIVDNIENGDSLQISGIISLDSDFEGHLSIVKSDSIGNPTRIRYVVKSMEEIAAEDMGEVLPMKELTISENSSFDEAIDILEKLNINYMTLSDTNYDNHYEFVFSREIQGTTPNIVYNYSGNENASTYRHPVGQELLLIRIDDNGLKELEWFYPSEIVKEQVDDVILLDFNEITDIFYKQILINNSFNNDSEYVEKRNIYIIEIKLGSMTVAQPNSRLENLIIPVWDFYGYEVIKYNEEYTKQDTYYKLNDNNERIIEEKGFSYLTINAIDRAKGY